jgi:hypothetical protein
VETHSLVLDPIRVISLDHLDCAEKPGGPITIKVRIKVLMWHDAPAEGATTLQRSVDRLALGPFGIGFRMHVNVSPHNGFRC